VILPCCQITSPTLPEAPVIHFRGASATSPPSRTISARDVPAYSRGLGLSDGDDRATGRLGDNAPIQYQVNMEWAETLDLLQGRVNRTIRTLK
jgi:hypothetical protein